MWDRSPESHLRRIACQRGECEHIFIDRTSQNTRSVSSNHTHIHNGRSFTDLIHSWIRRRDNYLINPKWEINVAGQRHTYRRNYTRYSSCLYFHKCVDWSGFKVKSRVWDWTSLLLPQSPLSSPGLQSNTVQFIYWTLVLSRVLKICKTSSVAMFHDGGSSRKGSGMKIQYSHFYLYHIISG